MEIVTKEGIKQIHAKTTITNIASQKVLEKNEFKHTASSDVEFEMNGKKLKFVHYIWISHFNYRGE
ncbi:hypothetical protein [Mesobacillus zeae]|uniref:hypothetical protein n=1 Tax=Mesobacillus zeae TaxID=1917180 RepID=UPI001FE39B51|nr:hypothetical protein [Mesobacillus zeae]